LKIANASLNAWLHRGLSMLAKIEADKAAARLIIGRQGREASAAAQHGSVAAEQAGEVRIHSNEYLPSFSHGLRLAEFRL
jgi:hypothetical protein